MGKFGRDLPLGMMFWGFFLAVPVILRIVLVVSGVMSVADQTQTGWDAFKVVGLWGIVLIAYYIVAFALTWQSATGYSERNGGLLGRKGPDWGHIAKIAMVLILATNGLTLI